MRDYVLDPEPVKVEKDPYPEYDPMGLYRPRPKRIHKPLPKAEDKDDRSIREMLTSLRVKSQLMPRGRATSDIDTFLEELNKPLPKSSVADYVPVTVESLDYDSDDYAPGGPDSLLRKKIDASRKELEDFDRLLDERFKGKHGGTSSASALAASRQAAEQSARESQRQRMMAASIAMENEADAHYEEMKRGQPGPSRDQEEYLFDDEV